MPPSLRRWLLWFVAWTFVGLFFVSQDVVVESYQGRGIPLSLSFRVFLTCAYTWLLMTPLLLRLARRFPLTENTLKHAAIHAVMSILAAMFAITVFVLIDRWWRGLPLSALPRGLKSFTVYNLHTEVIRYWVVIGIAHAIAASQLRAELAEARLDALKRQLHPHFLFNALNSISMLMFEDVKLANRMLLRLSELLRSGLTDDQPHEVTLEKELTILDRYLDIERIRFGDRLTIAVDVDPATLDARVPHLILQPLVENAIRYGVSAVEGPSTVSIRAERAGQDLRLHVRDDGPGLKNILKRGVGLTNTEARLRQLYGPGQRLDLASAAEGGLLVSITIPFRPATA